MILPPSSELSLKVQARGTGLATTKESKVDVGEQPPSFESKAGQNFGSNLFFSIPNSNFNNFDSSNSSGTNAQEKTNIQSSPKTQLISPSSQVDEILKGFANVGSFFADDTVAAAAPSSEEELQTEGRQTLQPMQGSMSEANTKEVEEMEEEKEEEERAKKFFCQFPGCGLGFASAEYFQRHCKTHETAGRDYVCNFPGCDKSFFYVQHLNRHRKTHQESRQYACSLCTHRFTKKAHLRKHLWVFHKDEYSRQKTEGEEKKTIKKRKGESVLGTEDEEPDESSKLKRLEDTPSTPTESAASSSSASTWSVGSCSTVVVPNLSAFAPISSTTDIRNLAKPHKCNLDGCQMAFETAGKLLKHIKKHEGLIEEGRARKK